MTTPPLLDLGNDVSLRRRWFVEASFAHPAKLHLHLLQWLLDRYTRPGEVVADPMAGVGSLLLAATQQRDVILREVEPGWLAIARANAAHVQRQAGLLAGHMDLAQADARQAWDFQADHLLFSPPYGCETGPSTWQTVHQRAKLGELAATSGRWARLLKQSEQSGMWGALMFSYGEHTGQIGHLRGAAYWQAMEAIYRQAHAALRPGGYLMLVIKDHIYRGERVRVADQTLALCQRLGFTLHVRHARRVWPMSLWTRRRLERGLPIVEAEDVLVLTHAPARRAGNQGAGTGDRGEARREEERPIRSEMETRFRCLVCGKLTAGRVPRGRLHDDAGGAWTVGDGTFRYPRRHKGPDGEECEGCWQEAEWVDVPRTRARPPRPQTSSRPAGQRAEASMEPPRSPALAYCAGPDAAGERVVPAPYSEVIACLDAL